MDQYELERKALYYKATQCYRRRDNQSHEEGLYYLEQASSLGSPEAYKLLGILYTSGQYEPFPARSMERAVKCYRKAAELGDAEAMYWLSQCYEMGAGTDLDPGQAALWRQMAVEAGFETEEEDVAPGAASAAKPKAQPEGREANSSAQAAVSPGKTGAQTGKSQPDPMAQTAPVRQAQGSVPGRISLKTEPVRVAEMKPEPVKRISGEKAEKDFLEADRAYEEAVANECSERMKKIPRKWALVYGSFTLEAVVIFVLLLFLLMRLAVKDSAGSGIFWVTAAVLGLVLTGLGCLAGRSKGLREAGETNAYENSAFCKGFRGAEPPKKEQSLPYRTYRGMRRRYMAARIGNPVELSRLNEGAPSRKDGLMIPGWIFTTRRGFARPDFVILTQKAFYVVAELELEGRISGTRSDALWTLRWESADKRGGMGGQYVRTLPNLLEENDFALQTVKSDLQLLDPLPIENIPYYNVVMFPRELDISGLQLEDTPGSVMLIQGGADQLISAIEAKDALLPCHGVSPEGLERLLKALAEKQYVRREERKDGARSSYRALNRAEFKDK
ncbi:MAG: sel1 repeat family protein [Lachnospiraceae bacterium]|nr:sel1 repeat family protein [Lachnospiraceae bacterium]